jgi:hypothetical protein
MTLHDWQTQKILDELNEETERRKKISIWHRIFYWFLQKIS